MFEVTDIENIYREEFSCKGQYKKNPLMCKTVNECTCGTLYRDY